MTKKSDIWLVLEELGGETVMVKKAIMEQVIEILPDLIIDELFYKIETLPPEVGSSSFRTWLVACRNRLNLTQTEISKATGIGQEDLSKFEKGKINFGTKRRTVIYEYLLKELHKSKAA